MPSEDDKISTDWCSYWVSLIMDLVGQVETEHMKSAIKRSSWLDLRETGFKFFFYKL